MPEQQNDQNLPAVTEKKKSGILKWVIFGVGSLVFAYAISLSWILFVEKPQEQVQNTSDILASDTTTVTEELVENPASPETEKRKDSLITTAETVEDGEITDPSTGQVAAASTNGGTELGNQSNTTIQNMATATEAASQQENENQQDFKKLAKIYSQMDAKDAAQILGKMNDDMVVGILSEMRDRNAAELLTAFSSSRAAKLSQELSKLGT